MATPLIATALRAMAGGLVRRTAAAGTAQASRVVELQARLAESLARTSTPQVDIRVLGIADTVKMLRTMSDKLRKRIVRRAAGAAARLMAKEVKDRTYDDNSRKRRTGRMEAAVRVTTRAKGDNVTAAVTVNNKTYTPFYWWFLERGTATRRTRKGANRGAIFPRPWVAPTANATQGRALSRFAAVLKSGVDRETIKARRGG